MKFDSYDNGTQSDVPVQNAAPGPSRLEQAAAEYRDAVKYTAQIRAAAKALDAAQRALNEARHALGYIENVYSQPEWHATQELLKAAKQSP